MVQLACTAAAVCHVLAVLPWLTSLIRLATPVRSRMLCDDDTEPLVSVATCVAAPEDPSLFLKRQARIYGGKTRFDMGEAVAQGSHGDCRQVWKDCRRDHCNHAVIAGCEDKQDTTQWYNRSLLNGGR